MTLRKLSAGLLAGAVLGWLAIPSALAVPRADITDAATTVHFDVYVPLRNAAELDQLLAQLHDSSSPQFRQWLTPAQFLSRFGPRGEDIATVQAALAARGFTVTNTHAHGMHVVGSAGAVQASFGARLSPASTTQGRTRYVATGGLQLPRELAAANARVVAFESVAPHRPHSKSIGPVVANRYSAQGGYWFDDLKQAYDFPSFKALSGRGRTIAIVMSSDFLDSDLAMYFAHEKMRPPHVTRVPVCVDFGGGNVPCGAPFDPNNGASFEVSLDLQQSGGMAPNASLRLYNIPDLSDQSVLTAYSMIVDSNAADIVSSSFGGPEAGYFASYNQGTDFTYILEQYEDIFRQGNAQGITFVASSGDQGGLPIPSVNYFYPDGNPVSWQPGVETPACSPHVTGVGGTNLVTTTPPSPQTSPPTLTSAYVGENASGDPDVPYDPYGFGTLVPGAWWGSGGGTSGFFNRPLYQFLVNTGGGGMRTVPDISLMMGGCPLGLASSPCPYDGLPRSYAITAVAGGFYGLIGTSISAPDIAGILALEEENLGGVRLGNVNYQIYLQAALSGGKNGVFHTGIVGFNGFDTATGTGKYNQVLGVGTPDVRRFIFAPFAPAAGNPQTPSNP